MKASILNPDCQNIVIKDKNGEIVSKSTLYVNREQGYGILNNIEINSLVKNEDKELIYNKYVLAIREFIEKYNKINPNKQIVQINVGMHSNDLEEQIKKYNSRGEILTGIDFSLYGKRSLYYGGDWKNSQYVIWKK